jgi:transglutaminase-like putative cysteine protease
MITNQIPNRVTLQGIPNGKEGAKVTLRVMGRFAIEGKINPRVRHLALSLVNGLNQKDYAGEIRALHAFVRDHVRYVQDTLDIETVHDTDRILNAMQGDCDDKSIILAALLMSIGHPSRFVAIALSPGEYSHVLVETLIGTRWVPLETTEPVEAGWYPSGVISRLVFHLRGTYT